MRIRQKKHKKYYAIKAYQILAQKSDAEMAKMLNISKRTYTDKIEGWSDFSSMQGAMLAQILNVKQDKLFVTSDVSNKELVG